MAQRAFGTQARIDAQLAWALMPCVCCSRSKPVRLTDLQDRCVRERGSAATPAKAEVKAAVLSPLAARVREAARRVRALEDAAASDAASASAQKEFDRLMGLTSEELDRFRARLRSVSSLMKQKAGVAKPL